MVLICRKIIDNRTRYGTDQEKKDAYIIQINWLPLEVIAMFN